MCWPVRGSQSCLAASPTVAAAACWRPFPHPVCVKASAPPVPAPPASLPCHARSLSAGSTALTLFLAASPLLPPPQCGAPRDARRQASPHRLCSGRVGGGRRPGSHRHRRTLLRRRPEGGAGGRGAQLGALPPADWADSPGGCCACVLALALARRASMRVVGGCCRQAGGAGVGGVTTAETGWCHLLTGCRTRRRGGGGGAGGSRAHTDPCGDKVSRGTGGQGAARVP